MVSKSTQQIGSKSQQRGAMQKLKIGTHDLKLIGYENRFNLHIRETQRIEAENMKKANNH